MTKPAWGRDYLSNGYCGLRLPLLRAKWTIAKRAQGSRPFLGIGDPELEGGPGEIRGVKLASLFTSREFGRWGGRCGRASSTRAKYNLGHIYGNGMKPVAII